MLVDEITQLISTIKPVLRPFHAIPIKDCGEKLVDLAEFGVFAFETPPPYLAAGAPYLDENPFMLREGVAARLLDAQKKLTAKKPGWKIKIFDGYRPIRVQAYMVAHTFVQLAHEVGANPSELPKEVSDALWEKVYRIWSPPNHNPATPPPHSSGAAFDCTLLDETGKDIDMGSPIDFNGDESDPDYFANRNPAVHANRLLLRSLMVNEGFLSHPREWWHYSYGDQLWTWLKQQQGEPVIEAIYGRYQ